MMRNQPKLSGTRYAAFIASDMHARPKQNGPDRQRNSSRSSFRFNRSSSNSRGLFFYRYLEQVRQGPVRDLSQHHRH